MKIKKNEYSTLSISDLFDDDDIENYVYDDVDVKIYQDEIAEKLYTEILIQELSARWLNEPELILNILNADTIIKKEAVRLFVEIYKKGNLSKLLTFMEEIQYER